MKPQPEIPAEPTKTVMDPLPSDVWHHAEHGQQWHREGKCVTCGSEKEQPEPYHCESCYTTIWPLIFDYDDD
jgi:hypothetical protein